LKSIERRGEDGLGDIHRPSLPDLYLSLTNSTAYSPTDTMPLSPRAKMTMGIQAVASLVTIGLLIARAVGSLS